MTGLGWYNNTIEYKIMAAKSLGYAPEVHCNSLACGIFQDAVRVRLWSSDLVEITPSPHCWEKQEWKMYRLHNCCNRVLHIKKFSIEYYDEKHEVFVLSLILCCNGSCLPHHGCKPGWPIKNTACNYTVSILSMPSTSGLLTLLLKGKQCRVRAKEVPTRQSPCSWLRVSFRLSNEFVFAIAVVVQALN